MESIKTFDFILSMNLTNSSLCGLLYLNIYCYNLLYADGNNFNCDSEMSKNPKNRRK